LRSAPVGRRCARDRRVRGKLGGLEECDAACAVGAHRVPGQPCRLQRARPSVRQPPGAGRRRTALPRHHPQPARRPRSRHRQQPRASRLPDLLWRHAAARLSTTRSAGRNLFGARARTPRAPAAGVRRRRGARGRRLRRAPRCGHGGRRVRNRHRSRRRSDWGAGVGRHLPDGALRAARVAALSGTPCCAHRRLVDALDVAAQRVDGGTCRSRRVPRRVAVAPHEIRRADGRAVGDPGSAALASRVADRWLRRTDRAWHGAVARIVLLDVRHVRSAGAVRRLRRGERGDGERAARNAGAALRQEIRASDLQPGVRARGRRPHRDAARAPDTRARRGDRARGGGVPREHHAVLYVVGRVERSRALPRSCRASRRAGNRRGDRPRARHGWRSAVAVLLTASVAIAGVCVLSPGANYLFSDPHGPSALVSAVQGGAPLDDWLPTFTEEQWHASAVQLAYWLAACALAGLATAAAVRWLRARSAPVAVTIGTFTLVSAAAALPGSRSGYERDAIALRGRLELMREYDASRLRAVDVTRVRKL